MTEQSLEVLAANIGNAADSVSRGAAMRELALGNLVLGNTALAEAWAERAMTIHEVQSMQNPSADTRQELLRSAGTYARIMFTVAIESGEEIPDHKMKMRRAADAARFAFRTA